MPRWLDLAGWAVERYRPLFSALAKLESSVLSDQLDGRRIDRPVFICGLARAGSTILLELLAAHPETASHRYRDFPFVHIPAWWNSFLDRAAVAGGDSTERFHEDRIRVSADSPEAMEEPIWVSFFPHCHDPERSNVLDGNSSYPTFERFYRSHVRKVLLVREGRRFLAKNNYNLSRIGYLRKLFPDARIVVPVRDPIGHVASSMRQHRIFSEKQRRDRSTRDYLRRAAHFEFGLDRRPVNVGDRRAARRTQRLWDEGREAAGWAHYWSSVYGFVADSLAEDAGLRESVLLLHYNDLCRRSFEVLTALYRHCGLEVDEGTLEAQAAQLSAPSYHEKPFSRAEALEIRRTASEVHDQIRRLCWQSSESS
ncbi:MAG: sulfotransferase family protein [Planctomycetota bacterium]